MKKIIFLLILMLNVFLCFGCDKKEDEDFLKNLNDDVSYKAEGIMESFFPNGRKQNDFKVYYKSKDYIKVSLKNVDNEDQQLIVKNEEGVYILIPSVNKNFKIQSSWPSSSSYPYLLHSLAKDLVNTENVVESEDENGKSFETETHIFKDANSNRQKIIVDKETGYPTEVLIYDNQGDLYIRVVYTKIEMEPSFSDDEFKIDETMNMARMNYSDDYEYTDRVIAYPTYYPEGMLLAKEDITSSSDGKEVLSIMKFASTNESFTLIQEFVNDSNNKKYVVETGEIIHVLGSFAIKKEASVMVFYNGIEYTVASNDISNEEMISVLESFMTNEEK